MRLAKYQQNGPAVLEKKSFKWLLPYMGMAAILNLKSLHF